MALFTRISATDGSLLTRANLDGQTAHANLKVAKGAVEVKLRTEAGAERTHLGGARELFADGQTRTGDVFLQLERGAFKNKIRVATPLGQVAEVRVGRRALKAMEAAAATQREPLDWSAPQGRRADPRRTWGADPVRHANDYYANGVPHQTILKLIKNASNQPETVGAFLAAGLNPKDAPKLYRAWSSAQNAESFSLRSFTSEQTTRLVEARVPLPDASFLRFHGVPLRTMVSLGEHGTSGNVCAHMANGLPASIAVELEGLRISPENTRRYAGNRLNADQIRNAEARR